MIVWFHIVLHYVDAVLSDKKGFHAVEGHSGRAAKIPQCDETRAIAADYLELYQEAKQARYEGTQYRADDLRDIEPLYLKIRTAMRKALNLPT